MVPVRDLRTRRRPAVEKAAVSPHVPKRILPRPGRKTVVGSKRDLHVLSEIGWAGMLTTGQVERLAFPSRRRAQRRLRVLLDRGLVRAHLQAEAMHRDNIWTLTKDTLSFLEERGIETDGLRAATPNVRSQKLRHALLVRDVAVSFLVAERRGILRLLDLRLDDELSVSPAMREAGLVPDGLARVESDGTEHVVLWEVASDAQPLAQVRAKLSRYDRAFRIGSSFFRNLATVIVAVERDARLVRLRTDSDRLWSDDLFRFASLDELADPSRLHLHIAPPLRETARFARAIP